MSIIQILIFFGVIIGIVFLGWIIIAALFLLYSWIEKKMLRKRIPETIRKEVEDARQKREQTRQLYSEQFTTGEHEAETDNSRIQYTDDNKQSERIQQVSDEPVSSDAGRPEQSEDRSESDNRFSQRRRLKRI